MPRFPLSPRFASAPEPVISEDEHGFLSRAGDTALGGLAAVGNFLDLPGSVVRDLLSFRNPLDQFLTPFSPTNRTSGRDMLRALGLVSKRDTFLNAGAGMALDFALDPLTYASLGTSAALTTGGKAARAVGLMKHAKTALATAERAGKAQNPLLRLATDSGMAGKAARGVLGAASRDDAIGTMSRAVVDAVATQGRRRAKQTMTIRDLLDEAGEIKVNDVTGSWTAKSADATPMSQADSAARRATNTADAYASSKERAVAAIDDYAKANGFTSGDDFMKRHGDEPLAKSARLGLPFGEQTVVNIPGHEKISVALDAAEALVANSLPGRAVTMLFHAPHMGMLSRTGKQMAEGAFTLRGDAAKQVDKWALDTRDELAKLAPAFADAFAGESVQSLGASKAGTVVGITAAQAGVTTKETQAALESVARLAAELAPRGGRGANAAVSVQDAANALKLKLGDASMSATVANANARQRVAEQLAEVTAKFKRAFDESKGEIERRGLNVGSIGNDLFSYWARRHRMDVTSEFRSKLFPTSHAGMKSRSAPIANVPTDVVQEIVASPLARDKKVGAVHIATEYGNYLDPHYGFADPQKRADALAQLPDQAAVDAWEMSNRAAHAEDIAEWSRSQSKRYTDPQSGLKFYPNSPIEDAVTHLHGAAKTAATMDAIFETILRNAKPAGAIKDGVPLLDLAGPNWAKLDAPGSALLHMAKMSGAQGDDAVALAQDLAGRVVDRELASDIGKMVRKSVYPEDVSFLGHYYDKATQFIKSNLTLPFPAFAIRNLGSGQAMNLHSEQINGARQYATYLESVKEAAQLMKSKGSLNPELMRELDAFGVYRYGFNPADIRDTYTVTHVTPPTITSLRDAHRSAVDVMKVKEGEGRLLRQYLGTGANAGPIGRVLDKTQEAYETVMEYGRRTSAVGEWFNRVPMYIYLRKQGWEPAAAAAKVSDIHVDYGKLSPFEKTTMRRLVPFYSFTRAQLEQTAARLMENQGGLPGMSVAGTIKAANRLRDPHDVVPDYIAETASIPLGEPNDAGDRSYLTGFGLAFEDPLSFFGKGLRGAQMEALSRLNPLLKAPLEYATGELFFQAGPMGGRDLPDADPLLGRTLANVMGRDNPIKLPELVEVGVANSPLSRYLSTTRQVFDPRKSLLTKAVNLGTGVRISTVSEGARDAILREDVQNRLRDLGARAFVRTYVPEAMKGEMSPRDLQEAERLTGSLNLLAKRAKRRKELKEASAAAITQ